ncbi:hypothetical protein RJ639_019277 [Escallonia herrerae]|uniref:Uncharacterized protein n=1 Tax=Escallonia herrerae TaxID=1293975 RepID=A0AA88V7S4_9ASTE|nr:hypothetical protein RJ639_019277 [Escallonia herrerae]
MGCNFSKKTQDSSELPPPSSESESGSGSHLIPDLTTYEAECRTDPDLRSFDSTVQQSTSRVINTLAVNFGSLTLDSLRIVSESLLETNQEVVTLILKSQEDIWKNKELLSLVEDYFESSLQTLDFCTALGRCLKRVRDTQLIIHLALKHFEEEAETKNYLKTLQDLKDFKAAGNPFSEEFLLLFQSVYRRQETLFRKLQIKKIKLDKKLKSVKGWRKLSNAIFLATFASVLICSVVAAAIAAPPVVTALAAAAAVPLGSMGKWFNSIWKKFENELKGQGEMLNTMQLGTFIAITDLDSIRVLVDKLEIEIEALLQNAIFAIREEDAAVMLAVEEIKKKLSGFVQSIEDLSEHSDKCSRDIRLARKVVPGWNLERNLGKSNLEIFLARFNPGPLLAIYGAGEQGLQSCCSKSMSHYDHANEVS